MAYRFNRRRRRNRGRGRRRSGMRGNVKGSRVGTRL